MQNETLEILNKVGAIVSNDHFVGASGLHFDTYVNKDALLPHTKEVSRICELFAQKYKDQNIEVVVAPALGGIILSQWTAYHLSQLTGREVLAIYTEKTSTKDQIFTRGYDKYIEGKRILILEDSISTGGSVIKVIRAVKEAHGDIIGVSVMVNKDPEKLNSETFGAPLSSLCDLPINLYSAENCPLCIGNVPINKTLGHGKNSDKV